MQHTLPVTWSPYIVWSHPLFGDGWMDRFIYLVDSRDGLPPSARAEAIKSLMKQLKRYRNCPCLWVQVDSPGPWYVTALRWALTGFKLDVAVLPLGAELRVIDFLNYPFGVTASCPSKPLFECVPFNGTALTQPEKAELQILRCLARVEYAGVKEIASLTCFSATYTRRLLARLQTKGLIKPFEDVSARDRKKGPRWTIRHPGIQYVYRSWNIPHRIPFRRKRIEQKFAGPKHREKCRIFTARLRKAYESDFEVWQSWTEPGLAGQHPDTIVWGSYQGVETLVWLEVETGKKKGLKHAKEIEDRFWNAKVIAERHNVRLIFVFLSMPWVLRAVTEYARCKLTPYTAIILDNWMDREHLARPVFNGVNSLSCEDGYKRQRNSKRLPRDPSFFDQFDEK